MHLPNQFSIVLQLLAKYEHDKPLSYFLKDYFRANKQMGSRDRKLYARMSYNYFRLGNALNDLSPEKRLSIAGFLCEKESYPLLEFCIKNHTSLTINNLEFS